MWLSWFTRTQPQAAGPASPLSALFWPSRPVPAPTGPDTDRPVATAHWPTPEDAGRLVAPWRPGKFLIGRDHQGCYYGIEDDRHILNRRRQPRRQGHVADRAEPPVLAAAPSASTRRASWQP